MDDFSKNFKAWLDDNSLKGVDVCPDLYISPGTLTQWRSKGVPERRQGFVGRYMARRGEKSGNGGSHGQATLALGVDMDTFEKWNRSALGERKTLSEWAVESLERCSQ